MVVFISSPPWHDGRLAHPSRARTHPLVGPTERKNEKLYSRDRGSFQICCKTNLLGNLEIRIGVLHPQIVICRPFNRILRSNLRLQLLHNAIFLAQYGSALLGQRASFLNRACRTWHGTISDEEVQGLRIGTLARRPRNWGRTKTHHRRSMTYARTQTFRILPRGL